MAEPARAVGHIGISVPDIDAAVAWYCDVFGLEQITAIGDLAAGGGGAIDDLCADIFGEHFGGVKVAQLASANGVAIELFEFVKPAYEAREEPFDYWRGGIFHFAFVASDAEHLAQVIEDNGGRRRSMMGRLFEQRPVRACYCEDPWGTVIEIISESQERAFANVT